MDTACHWCRMIAPYRTRDGRLRPLLVKGDGEIGVHRWPGVIDELGCPMCLRSPVPGSLPGFVPPV